MSDISISPSVPPAYRLGLRPRAVAALHKYGILDTPPETAFDNLARLAGSICGAPMAVITLIDERRQWLKAHIGLDLCELPLSAGFCPYVVASARRFTVNDALLAPAHASNPVVTSKPHARFYAGVPLTTPDCEAIGTLCVLDTSPGRLSEAQWSTLEMLADQVMAQIELRAANREIERQRQENVRLRETTEIENRKRLESEQERAHVMAGARCVLWYADVTEIYQPDELQWDARFVDPEAAQRYLPVEILPGETYASARYRARLEEDRIACRRLGTASIRAGKSYEQNFRCRALDGSIRWVHEGVHVETVVPGQKWRAVGVCTDVTDSMRAAQALQESEQLYRNLGEAVPDFVWACDAQGGPLFANQRWCEYTGLTLSSDDRLPMNVLHHPDDYLQLTQIWKQSRLNAEPYSAEFRLRRHDGVYRWFLGRAVPVKDEQGQIVQWIGTTTDIHDRRMAEEAQKCALEREHFLAESSAALASSLDYETTLSTIARLAVPQLADWCVVHIVEPDDSVRQLAIAHADPDKVSWAEELETRYPYDPRAQSTIAQVLQTGKSEYHPVITDAMLVERAPNEEYLQILREFGFTSTMTVPMKAHGRILGAITFVSAESQRTYEPADLSMAQDLAHSAALSVDNARLYLAAQREIDRRKQTEQQLRLHQEEIETLNKRLRWSVEVTHHHVRNNLQIISALTQLPIEEDTETVSVSALVRIGHHTSSLAAMHDLLMHQAKTDAHVDSLSARTAIERLVPLLQGTCSGRSICCRAADIVLPIHQIGSLCLLVNELVTNAIQHASGDITLTLEAVEDTARLSVCDAGPGFPPCFNWRQAAHTGLAIIDTAGRHDLRGDIVFENRAEGGGRVIVEFPLERSAYGLEALPCAIPERS